MSEFGASVRRRLTDQARRMQKQAIKRPLDAGTVPTTNVVLSVTKARVVRAFLAVERCNCTGETPIWHASVTVWSTLTQRRLHAEAMAREVAEILLEGVGEETTLWWWHEEALVGHLRAHLTSGEADHAPPSIPGPDDHDEPGEWYQRKVS